MGAVAGVAIRRARGRGSRPALERGLALTPRVMLLGAGAVARLPATSRVRRRVLQEAFSRGFAAINRGDSWFIPFAYEPDCEIRPAAGFRALGLADCYRGYAGWQALMDAVNEPLPDLHWTPEHLIDLGERWVVRLRMSGSGRASGARTEQAFGSVYEVSPRGRVARQDLHWTWDETLVAVGLRERT